MQPGQATPYNQEMQTVNTTTVNNTTIVQPADGSVPCEINNCGKPANRYCDQSFACGWKACGRAMCEAHKEVDTPYCNESSCATKRKSVTCMAGVVIIFAVALLIFVLSANGYGGGRSGRRRKLI